MIIVTRVAKAALEKALAENEDLDGNVVPSEPPVLVDSTANLRQPLIIKVDTPQESHQT
ncbi:hypothetical protein CDL12_09972 [Handroanthus impetiginosus]|nr:hypothetical protein CDL12_09972 [Handroanthus impetiginosus]